jgi:hypothetical protein
MNAALGPLAVAAQFPNRGMDGTSVEGPGGVRLGILQKIGGHVGTDGGESWLGGRCIDGG